MSPNEAELRRRIRARVKTVVRVAELRRLARETSAVFAEARRMSDEKIIAALLADPRLRRRSEGNVFR